MTSHLPNTADLAAAPDPAWDWDLTMNERRVRLNFHGYHECSFGAHATQFARGRSPLVDRVNDALCDMYIDELRQYLSLPTIALAVVVGDWDGTELC